MGESVEKELIKINNDFYKLNDPEKYAGNKGLIVQTDKSFETNCIILKQNGVVNPKKITVLEFFSTLETIKKQHKKDVKKNRRNSRRS